MKLKHLRQLILMPGLAQGGVSSAMRLATNPMAIHIGRQFIWLAEITLLRIRKRPLMMRMTTLVMSKGCRRI